MKAKEMLAIHAVEERDFILNENRRAYGEGFIAGFEKAREMAETVAIRYVKTHDMYFVTTGITKLGEEEVGP